MKKQPKFYTDPNGIRFPSSSNPDRPAWDASYKARLEEAFGGDDTELVPVKIPVDQASPMHLVGGQPRRGDVYNKMVDAGDVLPPVIAVRHPSAPDLWRIVDGNHRYSVAQAKGLKFIDGFEVVKKQKPATKPKKTAPKGPSGVQIKKSMFDFSESMAKASEIPSKLPLTFEHEDDPVGDYYKPSGAIHAVLEGKRVGSLHYYHDRHGRPDVLHAASMLVEEPHRGKGVGTSLYDELHRHIHKTNPNRFRYLSGDTTSAGSLRLLSRRFGEPLYVTDGIDLLTPARANEMLPPQGEVSPAGVIEGSGVHAIVGFGPRAKPGKAPRENPWKPKPGEYVVDAKIKKSEGETSAPSYPEPADHAKLPARIKKALAAVRHPTVLTDDLRHSQYQGHPNPYHGHCYVATEALAHMINAPKTGWKMNHAKHEGSTHFWLKHDATGTILDPTWDQFETPPPYDQGVASGPLTGWDRRSKRAETVFQRANAVLQKSEETYSVLAKAEMQQAGFRDKKTNEIIPTGPFHDISRLPEGEDADLDQYEAGFLDHSGKFYNREEAAAAVKAPADQGGLEPKGYFSGDPEPTVAHRVQAEGLDVAPPVLGKAIKDIPAGVQLTNHPESGVASYDYSHLLPPKSRSQYKVTLRVIPRVKSLNVHVEPISGGEPVGQWCGNWDVKDGKVSITPHDTQVDDNHRRRGLGVAMYEAAFAHGKHFLGATEVSGGPHSTPAAKLHQKISKKHGLKYQAEPNIGHGLYNNRAEWSDPDAVGDYDGRFLHYSYLLKAEFDPESHPRDAEGRFVATDMIGNEPHENDGHQEPTDDDVFAFASQYIEEAKAAGDLPTTTEGVIDYLDRCLAWPQNPLQQQYLLKQAGLKKAEGPSGQPLSVEAQWIQQQINGENRTRPTDNKLLFKAHNLDDLYRSLKQSSHNPKSHLLKYLHHRLENMDAYDTPEGREAADKQFEAGTRRSRELAGRQDGKEASVNDLAYMLGRNPHLFDLALNHIQEINKVLGPKAKDINGVPHIPLVRYLDKVNALGVAREPEGALASYSHRLYPRNESPVGPGKIPYKHWVPLKNVRTVFDLLPPAVSKSFHRTDSQAEVLVSPGHAHLPATESDVIKHGIGLRPHSQATVMAASEPAWGDYEELVKSEGVPDSSMEHQLPGSLHAEGYRVHIDHQPGVIVANVSRGGMPVGRMGQPEDQVEEVWHNDHHLREGLRHATKALLNAHIMGQPVVDGWHEPLSASNWLAKADPLPPAMPHGTEGPADGSHITQPHSTYKEATQAKPKGMSAPGGKNVWVRNHPSKSNADRTLMVQFSSDLLNGNRKRDASDDYYDKLYAKREGYHRADDFWEVPQWQGHLAHNLPNADHYTVRDPQEAIDFMKSAGYKNVAFSALDVNKDFIKRVADGVPDQKVVVGGYGDLSGFKDHPNIDVHDSVKSFVESEGQEYKPGYDYRHFSGSKTIPRLTLSDGCRHQCTFCSVPKQVDEKSREEILQQADAFAKHLPSDLIYLNDKTFGMAKNHTMLPELYQRIKAQNPNFKGFVIQTTAAQMKRMTPEFLKAAGIRHAEVGVESFNDPILRAHKKPATEGLIEEAANKLRQAGVGFIPNVMTGLDGENKQTYQRTLDFLNRHKDIISHVNSYNLALYDDSELGKQRAASATAADRDENQAVKSWMRDPQTHQDFNSAIMNFGSQQLDQDPHAPKMVKSEASFDSDDMAEFAALVWDNVTKLLAGKDTESVRAKAVETHEKQKLGKVDGKVVFLVDGSAVAATQNMDFVEGGNHERFPWIPDGEIWIDAHMDDSQISFILLHELIETFLMSEEGWSYDDAHDKANVYEKKHRAAELSKSEALVKMAQTHLHDTPEFKSWFKQSKAVDEDGKPKQLFHGTTHSFKQFKIKGAANKDNYYGRAHYFTDSPADVNENYSGEGPDLKAKIEHAADEDIGKRARQPRWNTPEYKETMQKLTDKYRKKYHGGAESVMPVYLSMQNPVVVKPHGGTHFFMDQPYDEEKDEYGEPEGNGVHLLNAIDAIADRYGVDPDALKEGWSEKLFEGMSAHEIEQHLRDNPAIYDLYENDQSPTELVRDIWQAAGHDGVIMDAEHAFPNMPNVKGATHYIAFNPTQIKSATGNSGAYSRRTHDITKYELTGVVRR